MEMEKGTKLRERMLRYIVNRYKVNHRHFVSKMNQLHAEIFNYGKSAGMNSSARNISNNVNRITNYTIRSRQQRWFDPGRVAQNGMESRTNYPFPSFEHVQQTRYFCYGGYHQTSHSACDSYRYSPY